MMSKVVIIYRTIPQYRIEFYNLLRERLNSKGIDLELIYGDNSFKGRNDSVHCDWATFKKNLTISIGRMTFIWQPCIKEVKSADLIIVEQASKLFLNFYLMFVRKFKNKKFAFWGHGLNFQYREDSFFNRFKLTYLNQPDWWFAYTAGIQSFLIKKGVSEDRITNVQNAIDTRALNRQYQSITDDEVAALKKQYKILDGEKVLIYCGALTKEKNLEFLLESATILKEKGHPIKLLIVGNGPRMKLIESAAKKNPWIIYPGSKFGRNKALHFRLADIFLLPGAMGLAILDSFAFETPLVSIDIPNHGPEFEYAIDGYNAVITKGNITDFTNKVATLLDNPEKLDSLKKISNCMINQYNIENMVDNFVDGIEKALLVN